MDGVCLTSLDAHYQALLYCAGDVKNAGQINVEGVKFDVFANLEAGLRRLRRPNSSLLV
jgi:hypothetical protein